MGCLCNPAATASQVLRHAGRPVTLLATGVGDGAWGDEDVACGDYLEALLTGRPPDIPAAIDRVRRSRSGLHYVDPEDPVLPASDLEMATRVDSFPSDLEVHREGDLLIVRPTDRSAA
jgi:2-phosphosulfolactate phosphatase